MANVNWNQYYQPQDNLILQGNPALEELQSGIIQQRKQQALDNKDYAAQVAKLNFQGARNADLDYLQGEYGKVVDTFGRLRATNNPTERAKLQQTLQEQQREFLYNAAKSKEHNEFENKLRELPLNPNANLEPNAPDNILNLAKMSSFDPKYQSEVQRVSGGLFAPKPVDVRKETMGIFKDLISKDTNTGIEKEPVTGMLVNKTTKTETVDKNAYTQSLLSRLRDPQTFRSYQRQVGGNTPEEVARKLADDTYDAYKSGLKPDVTTGQPFETPAQRESRSLASRKAYASWKEANIGDGGVVSKPVQQTIPYLGGKAIVQVPDYVPLSIPKKNFAGSPAYSLTDGKKVGELASSGDYGIVGVGSFPFTTVDIKDGNGKVVVPRGSLAQPNFVKGRPRDVEYKPMVHIKSPQTGDTEAEDLIIDFDRLPENIKSSKSVKGALVGFGGSPTQQEPQRKTIKSSDISAKASAAGYSVAEYTKLLKQKGITIE